MRIVIDMQGLQSAFSGRRGVGRYTENIVRQLILQNSRHEIFLALNGAFADTVVQLRDEFSEILPPDRIKVWHQFFTTSAMSCPESGLLEAGEIIRETLLNSLEPDIIFSTNLQEGLFDSAVTSVHQSNYPVLYCSTLHDVVPYFYPEYLQSPVIKDWYLKKIEYAKASDIVLTVSASSRRDIIDKLGIDPEKIFVVENAFDRSVFNSSRTKEKEARRVRKNYHLPEKFLFYYGGCDKHKNLNRLVTAYSSLPITLRDGCKLVIGGKDAKNDNDFQTLIKTLGMDDFVLTPGYILELDLPAVIKLSSGFVFPSTHEGFGLPALEAMACGVPVIGSNSSSIRDIINNPDALFDPYDIKDIAAKLTLVATDDKFRSELIVRSQREVAKYSWSESAQKLLGIFESFEGVGAKKGFYFGDPVQNAVRDITPHLKNLGQGALADIAKSVAETFPLPDGPWTGGKKFYVDISSVIIEDHRSGIQRVTRAISFELLKRKFDEFSVELVYSTPGSQKFFAAHKYMRDTFDSNVSPHDNYIDFKPGDILLYLDLHPSVAILNKDYNKYLRVKGVKVYHVVYDILPLLQPETFWPELCAEFTAWVDTVSVSDGAICISQAVADELKSFMLEFGEVRPDPFKIGSFHLGADISSSAPTTGLPADARNVLSKLKARPTFLAVGTIEPRKGHRQSLAAFELLWKSGADINLVFVGKLGWGMSEFSDLLKGHPELGARLYWLRGVSDEYLGLIYQASTCLLSPSDAEGFGLPLIEAAQIGIPIITRDIPVFREVADLHAYFFKNSKDPAVIASAVKKWLDLYRQEKHPPSRDMPYISWSQSAEQLINVIFQNNWHARVLSAGAIQPYGKQKHDSPQLEWRNFSHPEPQLRWTSGKEVALVFEWRAEPAFAQVRICCSTLDNQRVKFFLNGAYAGEKVALGHAFRLAQNLPHLKVGENTITLGLPDAKRPSPDDARILALAVHNIEIASGLPSLALDSSESHTSHTVEWHGFGTSEDQFRWTTSVHPWIAFVWDGNEIDVDLELSVMPLGRQAVKATIDDVVCFDGILDSQHSKLRLHFQNLTKGYHIVQFTLPDARQPGPGDSRLLGLAVRSLKLIKAKETPASLKEIFASVEP